MATWIKILLVAYCCAALDNIVTARGILAGIGEEGNPLYSWIPGGPQDQVIAMTATDIIAVWILFYVLYKINTSSKFTPGFRKVANYSIVIIWFTRLLGASTWIM